MQDCIFCQIARGEAPSWKVYEDEHTYAFLDIHPVNRYHTLVIPKTHYENVFDTPKPVLAEMMQAVKKIVDLYYERLGINNVQIFNSSGKAAQQDVFHVHFHIVPRHLGDEQNVRWRTHPEWVAEYDEMLRNLSQPSP
ncbi:MAG TPA: HIT family protein [Chloroflexi bacterium]|nr:HIT family protein [Chloroflexota bacterium]